MQYNIDQVIMKNIKKNMNKLKLIIGIFVFFRVFSVMGVIYTIYALNIYGIRELFYLKCPILYYFSFYFIYFLNIIGVIIVIFLLDYYFYQKIRGSTFKKINRSDKIYMFIKAFVVYFFELYFLITLIIPICAFPEILYCPDIFIDFITDFSPASFIPIFAICFNFFYIYLSLINDLSNYKKRKLHNLQE